MDVSSNENIPYFELKSKSWITKMQIHLRKNFRELFIRKQTLEKWMILENDSASSNFYFYFSIFINEK